MDAPILRLGDYREIMRDVECQAIICDPPYGERTHAKQTHGRHLNQAGTSWITARALGYAHWTEKDVSDFVDFWSPRTSGWFCAFTSHDLITHYEAALKRHGRTCFAPISCVQSGMNVRLAGDGPSNWTTYLVRAKHRVSLARHLFVARPKSLSKWGTLPGAYYGTAIDPGQQLSNKNARIVAGGKPLWLMRAIIRDYSRPGDTVVDPCGGGFTTAIAAHMEGRRSVSSEIDPVTFGKAETRVKAYLSQQPLFGRDDAPVAEQSLLFNGDK